MIRLHFTADDLGRARFAMSPIWETISSLRTLTAANDVLELHRPWRSWMQERLNGPDLDLLTTLVRPAGYIPDFLVPSPAQRASSFDAALHQVANADPVAVSWQLRHLAGHRVAAPGPRRTERTRLLHHLADRPGAAVEIITAALERYWYVALAPHWTRLQAVLRADIAYRLEQLADDGLHALLRTLHPSVSYADSTLSIVKYYDGDANLSGRGLLLVPCAFAWPDVFVLTAEPNTPTVSYSPRGVGTLWQRPESGRKSPLTAVLGRTRTALLRQLDLPMTTTQLTTALALSAPTLNVHLRALEQAGILTARRDGRNVLYARTELGIDLLAAAPQEPVTTP